MREDSATIAQNEAVVRQFIAAMSDSDPVMADACLGPDAFTIAKGFGKFAGIRHRDTMVGTIGAFQTLLPTGLRLSIKTMTAQGDRVIAECEGDAMTSAGRAYCNQYCFVFTMKDGRIGQVNEYFCNILADDVLWPLVEAMEAR